MAKSATNTWDVYGTLDGTAMAAKVGTLTFGNNGVLAGGSPMTATLSATNPLLNNVALDFTGT
ncbi:flagellar basal body FlgE domain-containing protein, partial [Acinetobacter baumannii]